MCSGKENHEYDLYFQWRRAHHPHLEMPRTWIVDRQRGTCVPSLDTFPSLGQSAVGDVVTVGLRLPAYLMNHISISPSSRRPQRGRCENRVPCGQHVKPLSL